MRRMRSGLKQLENCCRREDLLRVAAFLFVSGARFSRDDCLRFPNAVEPRGVRENFAWRMDRPIEKQFKADATLSHPATEHMSGSRPPSYSHWGKIAVWARAELVGWTRRIPLNNDHESDAWAPDKADFRIFGNPGVVHLLSSMNHSARSLGCTCLSYHIAKREENEVLQRGHQLEAQIQGPEEILARA